MVVLVHGLGEHSSRYAHVADALVDAGCAAYAMDHRGHGKSGGPRVLVDRFANAVEDIDYVVELARRLVREWLGYEFDPTSTSAPKVAAIDGYDQGDSPDSAGAAC